MKKNIVIILFFGVLFLSGCSQGNTPEELAQCLTEKGAVMYGTDWCGHCQNQKAVFGESFQYINFVNCEQNKDECQAANVPGYPTWQINGKNYPGEKSLAELAGLAGC